MSESQREKQLCLVLQDSVYRRGSTFLCLSSFFPLCSFAVPLFATASSVIFASHLSLLIAVSSWSSTLTFHSPPFSFSSFQSCVCLFSLLVDGVRGFLKKKPKKTTCSLSCPPPSITSHGHPCILQVRAGRVCECGQM